MQNNKGIKKKVFNITLSILMSLVLSVFIDFVFTFLLKMMISPFVILFLFICMGLLLFFIKQITIRKKLIICIVFVAIISITSLSCYGIYSHYYNKAEYYQTEGFDNSIFTNKKVMVIVPHEDDDINLVGGVIENYIESGSEVFPVFITNGDAFGNGEIRLTEALRCWTNLGVPKKNVIFLGYGDKWEENSPHIYNADANAEMISADGKGSTYGIAEHPAYHDGIKYTHSNLLSDLVSVIKEKKPNVIFASDYDNNQDHRAASLFFEKSIGIVLREEPDYKPIVYKGYAYSTAWEAKNDFFNVLNILSTTNDVIDEKGKEHTIYQWEKRIRLPVNNKALSRSIFNSSVYKSLKCYESQYATSKAPNIINGDKVFWQRRTDSVLYNSSVKVTSGEKERLIDFRILDSDDVIDSNHEPFDGVWVPEESDHEKTVHFMLKHQKLSAIYLYDNPSAEDNIMNAKIQFNDGTVIQTGELNPNGAPTIINVNKTNVESFSVTITDCEGENAGLSEVEAFSTESQKDNQFIKIQDLDGNFAYDYYTDKDMIDFDVYSNDEIPPLSSDQYTISCDNSSCDAQLLNGKIRVNCPIGERCVVTVLLNEKVTDSISVYHMKPLEKTGIELFRYIEERVVYPVSEKEYYNLATYRLFHEIKSVLF